MLRPQRARKEGGEEERRMAALNIGRWLRNLALLMVIAAFIVFYGPALRDNGGLTTVGEVNGERIKRAEFEYLREFRRGDEERLREQGMSGGTIRDLIDRQTIEQLVQLYLLAQEARDLGFSVSDSELRESICSDPSLQTNGRCDPSRFQRAIRQVGFDTEQEYLAFRRRQILAQKLQSFVAEPIKISRSSARQRLRREQTTIRLQYVTFRKDSFEDAVTMTEEQAMARLDELSDAIRAEYERRRSEFQRPEEVRARHILLKGDDAEQKAQAALERLDEGADFVQLATELSEDQATVQVGGDLGFFPKGRVYPELEAAAFEGEPGKILGPVKTEAGIHLVRVEQKREGVDISLEEATPQLAKEIATRELTSGKALEQAREILKDVSAGQTLAEAAQARGLPLSESATFAPSSTRIPGLPPVPGMREAALTLSPEAPTAPQPFDTGEAYLLISLLERNEPDESRLDGQLEQAQLLMTRQAQQQMLDAIYRQRRQEAEESGAIQLYPLYGPG